MSRLEKVPELIATFFEWWIDELKGLLPDFMISNEDKVQNYLRIIAVSDTLEISRITPNSIEALASCQRTPKALGQALKDLRTGRKALVALPIRYEIAPPAYMVWGKTRPGQAYRRLLDLAKIDVRTSTPLGNDAVIVAVDIVEKTNREIKTQDYAMKKRRLEDVQNFFSEAGVTLDQLGPLNSCVDFLAELNTARSHQLHELQKWSLITAACTAIILGGLWIRQENTLSQLDEQATRLQASAVSARAKSDELQTRYDQLAWMIDRCAGYSSMAENWEILSSALPDQAWLSELQMSGNQLTIIGFAQQAAPLVGVLEGHPSFESVKLTAPISLDSRRGAERFSISMESLIRWTSIEVGAQ